MWEAFLLQMDDFDRWLEFQLRRKLDAVVRAPVPARRVRHGLARFGNRGRVEAATKKMGGISTSLRPDMLVFVEHS